MRLAALLSLLSLLTIAACDKPTEEECRKANQNMLKIEGVENATGVPDSARFVRQCRSQYSKKAVDCIINAKTSQDVDACLGSKKK